MGFQCKNRKNISRESVRSKFVVLLFSWPWVPCSPGSVDLNHYHRNGNIFILFIFTNFARWPLHMVLFTSSLIMFSNGWHPIWMTTNSWSKIPMKVPFFSDNLCNVKGSRSITLENRVFPWMMFSRKVKDRLHLGKTPLPYFILESSEHPLHQSNSLVDSFADTSLFRNKTQIG